MKRRTVPRPRGTDFLINWSIGFWSEECVLEAMNNLGHFIVFRYGVSRVGPFTFEEFKKYYERLQKSYLHGKRPDLIVFDKELYQRLSQDEKQILEKLVGLSNSEADPVIEKALFGVEVEVSKWHAEKMLQYHRQCQQQGKRKSSIMGPTFTIKQEDLDPLTRWIRDFRKEIVVVQVFYDKAYIIPFSQALSIIWEYYEWKCGRGSRPEGIRAERDRKTGKYTYYISCQKYGRIFGFFNPTPSSEAKVLVDEKGMLWPMIEFVNGKLDVTQDARDLLNDIRQRGILYPQILKRFNR
jgi:hypothetical protein